MLTGERIRVARELLGWTRADLARKAFVPLAVVEVVEEHGSTFMLVPGQMATLRRASEEAGVEFAGAAGGPRLKHRP